MLTQVDSILINRIGEAELGNYIWRYNTNIQSG